jgi:hypothetical protein
MPKSKTVEEAPSKAEPAPSVDIKPEEPEKQSGPGQVMRANQTPATPEMGAPERARNMKIMQQSLGNRRVGQWTATPAASSDVPMIQRQTKAQTPKKAPPLQAARASVSAAPPPNGQPPPGRAIDTLVAPGLGSAAGRARLMRAMQGAVGNTRVNSMLQPPVTPSAQVMSGRSSIARARAAQGAKEMGGLATGPRHDRRCPASHSTADRAAATMIASQCRLSSRLTSLAIFMSRRPIASLRRSRRAGTQRLLSHALRASRPLVWPHS